MSILLKNEVANFLGISPTTDGLQEAVDQAELLVAGKLNLDTLELTTYTNERRVLTYNTQQVIPRHGPIQELTAFSVGGTDELANVVIAPGQWSIRWAAPYAVDFDRVRGFPRMSLVSYTYSAGWTHREGDYPVPRQVEEYSKALTGIVLQNLLASGVYDTKLGDMTIKIQRETLEKNLEVYDKALRRHSRPI